MWHSNDPNRKVIFQCNQKFTNDKRCCTPHFSELGIKERFLRAFNRLMEHRDGVISNSREEIELFCSTADTNTRFAEAQSEAAVVAELISKAVKENASVALNQSEYEIRYKGSQTATIKQ